MSTLDTSLVVAVGSTSLLLLDTNVAVPLIFSGHVVVEHISVILKDKTLWLVVMVVRKESAAQEIVMVIIRSDFLPNVFTTFMVPIIELRGSN